MTDILERLDRPVACFGELRELLNDAKAEIERLRAALLEVRSKGIVAGAAFVRRNPDGADRCREVLDIIDEALK